ncbi:MAG: PIN domain-containing protein [Solirubrobacteraceae bacterium MAG38_C4-C5]|nr:PIN domain-containing protein [Candidatus Siliceabacter maunaloa]
MAPVRGGATARIAFDSGVLIALERNRRDAFGWLDRAIAADTNALVSAAALAEVWREPARLRLVRALRLCVLEPVDERLARTAGAAIGATGASLGDALIAASAARAGALLVTADRDDMDILTTHFRSLRLASL